MTKYRIGFYSVPCFRTKYTWNTREEAEAAIPGWEMMYGSEAYVIEETENTTYPPCSKNK